MIEGSIPTVSDWEIQGRGECVIVFSVKLKRLLYPSPNAFPCHGGNRKSPLPYSIT